jgi:Fe2+ transport system protein FeoA
VKNKGAEKDGRSLWDLKQGEESTVKSFNDSGIACKLLTIGIVPKARIALIRRSPFGGAACIRLGGTYIAVRKSEAKSILIN